LGVQRTVGRSAKTRKTYLVNGASPSVEFRAHNNNIVNLERAVNERVFLVARDGGYAEPPRPRSSEFFAGRLSGFRKLLATKLFKTTPISYDQFVGLYTGRRRLVYQQAADSLLRGETLIRRDAMIRCFVKAEKVNFSSKSDPTPRVIQPRSPRYNIEVGRYLRPIEERIYKSIAKVFGSRTVFKGMNAVEQGKLMSEKWRRFRNPVAVGLDASRFDQHVSPAALAWEHEVYASCFRDPEYLKELLSWQLSNSGVGFCADGRLRYTVDGCRMSGDMNTALGNCLLMCAMVHAYCAYSSITQFELANNGDDCVVIMESDCLGRFTFGLDAWFTEMGFTMKVESPVYELERIEFCQTRPVLGPRGYTMTRIPQVAMAKDCMSLVPVDRKCDYDGWLAAVGLGGLSLTSGMPVWQSFYRAFVRGSSGARPKDDDQHTGFKMLASRLDPIERPVTQEARYSFWLAFGVTPDAQMALEEYYDRSDLSFAEYSADRALERIPAWFN
jgi:hypothetical protein